MKISFPDDHKFRASLLQRVELTSSSLQRKIVLFCDNNFITNATSETTSRISMPAFSAILYETRNQVVKVGIVLAIVMFSFKDPSKTKSSFRLRLQIAPLRVYRKFASYLPYVTMEHDQSGNGVAIEWIEASAVVDGHFLVPVLGLKNSVPFEKLPPWTSYNLRGGSR